MSEVVKRAEEAVDEARQDTAALELVAALLAAQQQAPPACQHQAPAPVRQSWPVGKVLAVTGGVVAGGAVLTGMFLAVALTACSVAVCAVVIKQLLDGGKR